MTPTPQKKRGFPFKRKLSRKLRRIVFMLVAAAIVSGINYYNKNHNSDYSSEEISSTLNSQSLKLSNEFSRAEQTQTVEKIRTAKNNTNAQFWVGFNGKIVQILKDDNRGSRHQKFLISPVSDITLLVAHNIDLSKRVPIKKGDTISLYGRYEWNNRGGVIHWTHHDPKGKKKGGWIEANGKVYR